VGQDETADLLTAGGTGCERLDTSLLWGGGEQLLGFCDGETGLGGEHERLRYSSLGGT
jgi:hypothetical protein